MLPRRPARRGDHRPGGHRRRGPGEGRLDHERPFQPVVEEDPIGVPVHALGQRPHAGHLQRPALGGHPAEPGAALRHADPAGGIDYGRQVGARLREGLGGDHGHHHHVARRGRRPAGGSRLHDGVQQARFRQLLRGFAHLIESEGTVQAHHHLRGAAGAMAGSTAGSAVAGSAGGERSSAGPSTMRPTACPVTLRLRVAVTASAVPVCVAAETAGAATTASRREIATSDRKRTRRERRKKGATGGMKAGFNPLSSRRESDACARGRPSPLSGRRSAPRSRRGPARWSIPVRARCEGRKRNSRGGAASGRGWTP